jgi:hypothetical protein
VAPGTHNCSFSGPNPIFNLVSVLHSLSGFGSCAHCLDFLLRILFVFSCFRCALRNTRARAFSLALKRDCLLVCSSHVLSVFVLLASRAGQDFVSPVQIRFFLISSDAVVFFSPSQAWAQIFDFPLTFFVSHKSRTDFIYSWSRLFVVSSFRSISCRRVAPKDFSPRFFCSARVLRQVQHRSLVLVPRLVSLRAKRSKILIVSGPAHGFEGR